MTIYYKELADAEVPSASRAAAADVFSTTANSLGVSDVKLVWVTESDVPTEHRWGCRVNGWAANGVAAVWISADLDVETTQKTIVHELRHVWQYRAGMRDRGLRELDSRSYEARILAPRDADVMEMARFHGVGDNVSRIQQLMRSMERSTIPTGIS